MPSSPNLLAERICQFPPHVSLVDGRLVERLLALYYYVLFVQLILEGVHLQFQPIHLGVTRTSYVADLKRTNSLRAASKQRPSQSHRPCPPRPEALQLPIGRSSPRFDLHMFICNPINQGTDFADSSASLKRNRQPTCTYIRDTGC